MYFIPLTQIESVELVIHALRVAGGQADCSSCPARRVCMQQCLTIADAVARMHQTGTLPQIEVESIAPPPQPPAATDGTPERREGHLRRIK